ncbi:MAG: hypothetical protein COA43_09565 [Robiginitomaculum sp.]|nr:MAG: hypothetical protein COA43_09565 [Robiginitomaculum sp.]
MNISKFALASTVFAATIIGAAMPMTASAASTIKSASDCEFEGGSMTNVKGSDYCLVQMRPEEYAGAEYDGNQLGVVDCPGSKLNNDLFCLYPVTVNKARGSDMFLKLEGIDGESKDGASISGNGDNNETKSVDMFLKLEGIDGESRDSAQDAVTDSEQVNETVVEAPKKLTSRERRAAKRAAKAAKKAAEKAAKEAIK